MSTEHWLPRLVMITCSPSMAVWLSGSLMKYCLCAPDPDDRAEDASRSSRDSLTLIWAIVTGNKLRQPRGEGASLDNNSTNIFPLLSIQQQRNSGGQAWGQSQNKTASVFFNNKTLQWITKYYFKNYFIKLCWQEQIWCHFNFHWNNIWKINFIQ